MDGPFLLYGWVEELPADCNLVNEHRLGYIELNKADNHVAA
jgi:hypothetical protein